MRTSHVESLASAAETAHPPVREQIRFLHRVLGLGFVLEDAARRGEKSIWLCRRISSSNAPLSPDAMMHCAISRSVNLT